jgi:hypothetical protein
MCYNQDLFEVIQAPNRYRKMWPWWDGEDSSHQGFINKMKAILDEFGVSYNLNNIGYVYQSDEVRRLIQANIVAKQREEFPEKKFPLGMHYSFVVCDEVIVWYRGEKDQYDAHVKESLNQPSSVDTGLFIV